MNTITATEFKAKCLQILDQIQLTGEVLQITKHGKVVAELRAPEPKKPEHSGLGFARETIKTYGDVVSPVEVEWDALKNGH